MPVVTEEDTVRLIPQLDSKAGRWVTKRLLSTRSITRLNIIYDRLEGKKGPDFAEAFLEDQGIDYMIGGAERLAALREGPFITISNHPYGHLDGMMLIDLFGHLRPDYMLMVNSLLSLIRPLETNFIEVVPTGRQRTAPRVESINGVRTAMEHLSAGAPMGIFPSGAVSDLSLRDRCIRDREWQDSAVRMIMKAQVPVVPVRFFDGNSAFYYSLGLISPAVRLLRLPAEILNKGGRTIRLGIGETIGFDVQKRCGSPAEFKRMIRSSVYGMQLPDSFVRRSELSIDP